jgi:hypothetical protein
MLERAEGRLGGVLALRPFRFLHHRLEYRTEARLTDPQQRTVAHILQAVATLVSLAFGVPRLMGRPYPLPPVTLLVGFACLIGALVLFAKTGKL